MFTITINGNTPEDLYSNLRSAADMAPRMDASPVAPTTAPQASPTAQQAAQVAPSAPTAQQAAQVAPSAPTAPAATAAPAVPAAVPAAVPVTVASAAPAPISPAAYAPPAAPATMPAVPTATPAYTIEAIAKAGASLAQNGKLDEARALLAQYGAQAVGQLDPKHYGAVAAGLRALGAQL